MCGKGGELKANPSLLPGPLLLPAPPPHASPRLPAGAHAGDRRGPWGSQSAEAGEGFGGGHAGPSRVSGGREKKARAGGAGSRLSCEGREMDTVAPRRAGTGGPPLEGARDTRRGGGERPGQTPALRGAGGRSAPPASGPAPWAWDD